MAKYFVLVEREAVGKSWSIQFGDYDREVVDAERDERRDKGARASNLKVLTVASARQSMIDLAVAELNGVVSDQPRHTRIVTELLMSSCGDLMLDRRGDLCRREIWSEEFKELPWDQHKPGCKLAIITRFGWTLTGDGAQYILENCSPGSASDVKFLQGVVRGAHNAMLAKLNGEG